MSQSNFKKAVLAMKIEPESVVFADIAAFPDPEIWMQVEGTPAFTVIFVAPKHGQSVADCVCQMTKGQLAEMLYEAAPGAQA